MFLRWTHLLCGCIALFSLATSAVWAGSNKVSPPLPVYIQECGSCHVPFPANFLPKASWGRVMNDLEKHYGSDACLDPVTHKQIETWLQSYGGLGKRAKEEPQQDRITRSAWFERKHREVSEATFKRASIKSPANCMACHRDAAHGDFEDHNVSIPK
jgi:nitrate/TMAO reductase-like tetraheme cytochrome c subunit